MRWTVWGAGDLGGGWPPEKRAKPAGVTRCHVVVWASPNSLVVLLGLLSTLPFSQADGTGLLLKFFDEQDIIPSKTWYDSHFVYLWRTESLQGAAGIHLPTRYRLWKLKPLSLSQACFASVTSSYTTKAVPLVFPAIPWRIWLQSNMLANLDQWASGLSSTSAYRTGPNFPNRSNNSSGVTL